MRNIILADNQLISSLGWRYVFQKQYGLTQLHEAVSKKELIGWLTENQNSLVIMDYTLFDFESVTELQILQARFPKVDWILFSEDLSNEFLRALLLNTQTFSVLMKDASENEILDALKDVLEGKRYICNHATNVLIEGLKKTESSHNKQVLTPTEQEILKEIALGKTTKEIALHRFVSVHTIMTHRKNIFRKIEVNNVHEATKYAMRAGIVDLAEYYI